jgi:S-formylglutathione hydrolase FrmB
LAKLSKPDLITSAFSTEKMPNQVKTLMWSVFATRYYVWQQIGSDKDFQQREYDAALAISARACHANSE